MNVGLVFAIGESFRDFTKHGQDKLVVDQDLKAYSQSFKKVFIFSYEDEKYQLFSNNQLIANTNRLHRFIYCFLMPVLKSPEIKQCDVLRGFQVTGGIPCLIAKILWQKPFLINYGYDYQAVAKIENKPIKSFLYALLSTVILKAADGVIVATPKLAQKVKGHSKKVFVIPNSVDTQMFKPKETKNFLKSVKKIIFVGRLEPQKNLISLLEAVSTLEEKPALVFIGKGSQKKNLVDYAKRNHINLTIIGVVSHRKLPGYLRSADLFILPSFTEGHPKALLEAMSCGLPCIGANVDGINDVIIHKKNGILTGTTAQEIRKGIKHLLKNKQLIQKLSKSARSSIIESYDAKVILKKEIQLVKNVALNSRKK